MSALAQMYCQRVLLCSVGMQLVAVMFVGMSYTVHQPVDARLIFSIAMIWIINVGRMLRIPPMDTPIF